jgi:hypothetical protein
MFTHLLYFSLALLVFSVLCVAASLFIPDGIDYQKMDANPTPEELFEIQSSWGFRLYLFGLVGTITSGIWALILTGVIVNS